MATWSTNHVLPVRDRLLMRPSALAASQGRLDTTGWCSQTSLEKLDGLGLKSLCPWLYDHVQRGAGSFANRIVEICQLSKHSPVSTDEKDVRTSIVMAQACLGSSWVLPFAAILLSLRHRDSNCQTIQHGFATMFTRTFLYAHFEGDKSK